MSSLLKASVGTVVDVVFACVTPTLSTLLYGCVEALADRETPADKQRETLARKKLAELANLHEQEAFGKSKRTVKPSEKAQVATLHDGTKQATGAPQMATPAVKPTVAGKPSAASRRRLPADIESNDENKLDSELEPATKAHKAFQPHARDGDGDDDEENTDHSEDEQDEEEPEDDLLNFSSDEAAKTLKSEHAKFADDDNNDLDDEQEELNATDLELTTASEGDANPMLYDDDDEVDDMPRVIYSKANSKRAQDRRAEVPKWQDHDILSDDDDDDISNSNVSVNANWHHQAHYIPAKSGSRLISIHAQSLPIQNMIQAAICIINGDIIFVNAYVSDAGIMEHYQQVLEMCARWLEYVHIVERVQKDHSFCVVIGRLLGGCVSLFRLNVKKIMTSSVQGFYQLGHGDACKKKVEDLFASVKYIFPVHEAPNGSVLIYQTKPFLHPAIISTLQQLLTSGARRSLLHKHKDRFTSIIETGPRSEELEMPIPIIALVATCYYASLKEWRTGTCISAKFNADQFEDIYIGHVKTLEEIQTQSPDKYHRLMADIYSAVCQGTSVRTTNVSNGALSVLDLDGMEV